MIWLNDHESELLGSSSISDSLNKHTNMVASVNGLYGIFSVGLGYTHGYICQCLPRIVSVVLNR